MTTGGMAAVLLLSSIMIFQGCGSGKVDGSTWLLRIADDTLTVADLGRTWLDMDQAQRNIFLEKDNTVGEFIVTYGRKLLLEKELKRIGYPDDPELLSFADSWLKEKTGEAFRKLMYDSSMAGVTREDVDTAMERLGIFAFFTINPGTESEDSYGPVHMPSLPMDMLLLLDSLEEGETGVTETGEILRLDSLRAADEETMSRITADSAALHRNITYSLAERNFNEKYDELIENLRTGYELSLDTLLLGKLAEYYAGEGPLPDREEVLMESRVGKWTVGEVMRELKYYEKKFQVDPSDEQWLLTVLEFLHYNRYAASAMEDEHREILDSLAEEGESYLLEIAADSFYADSITAKITVTGKDMLEFFNNMESPLTVPEKRIFRAVVLSRDSASTFLELPPGEREDFLAGAKGFEYLAADSSNLQVTRPLTVNEVPGFHGEEAFGMDPSDTASWLGPLDLYDSDRVCLFKLLQVFPERNATLEEVEDRIRNMTRAGLEEKATVEIFRRLEEKYGFTVNEDILKYLPEDPGLWAEL